MITHKTILNRYMLQDVLQKNKLKIHVIYLHGFRSSHLSVKGQLLADYCKKYTEYIDVFLPDLNQSPQMNVNMLNTYIQSYTGSQIVLVGSSLGGFYANYFASYYDLPAVLINPAMTPWQLFETYFGQHQLPFSVTKDWIITQDDLKYLQYNMVCKPTHLKQILLLLQTGDEVLDYQYAANYYQSKDSHCMMLLEQKGDHVMRNFADKIPMLLMFLIHRCLSRNI